jgi:hypothetical protein
MADKPTPDNTPDGGVAEPAAGPPTPEFAQAILDEHAYRIPLTYPGVVNYQGVATWAPGDAVASSHPGFAALREQGLLEPIER